jgi:HK97 family phage portal protein
MRLFGFNLIIQKAAPTPTQPLQPAWWSGGSGWWWPIIREPFTGAWQKNMELRAETLVSYFAVYACVSLISCDIGKLRLRLMQQTENGLWKEVNVPAFSPVLRKPNHYQTRSKFIEQWLVSKLLRGNAYVLKERDSRGVVVSLYVLDPCRVQTLVAPDGSVFYSIGADNLSGVLEAIRIPASEIIHDVMVPLFHPLCGVSPLVAAALPVSQGLSIQSTSAKFFANGSRPGGIIYGPTPIDEEKARRFKHDWENNFTGENSGRVAIIENQFKYEPLDAMAAEDAQLIEQLKWTAENVASVFHVPAHMIGIAPMPAYDANIEARTQQYYSQCLQTHIEAIESLLDEGLGLSRDGSTQVYGTEFDLDDLLRMDTKTKVDTTAESVRSGFVSPNEARARFNLPPTPGGEAPLMQQQNFPLPQLDRPVVPQAAPPPQPSGPVNVGRVIALARTYH